MCELGFLLQKNGQIEIKRVFTAQILNTNDYIYTDFSQLTIVLHLI